MSADDTLRRIRRAYKKLGAGVGRDHWSQSRAYALVQRTTTKNVFFAVDRLQQAQKKLHGPISGFRQCIAILARAARNAERNR